MVKESLMWTCSIFKNFQNKTELLKYLVRKEGNEVEIGVILSQITQMGIFIVSTRTGSDLQPIPYIN